MRERINEMEVGYRESGIILAFFAAGFSAIYLTIALMYARVLSLADEIGLSLLPVMISMMPLQQKKQLLITCLSSAVSI